MHRRLPPRLIIIPLALFILMLFSGCAPSGDESGSSEHTEFADVPLKRQDSTKYFKYDIRLPKIIRTNSILRDTLTALADKQQKQFLSNADQDSMPKSYAYPWELQLHVTVEDSTAQFISLLGEGYTFTGGAHGMPFYITLNYNQEQRHFVSLNDMFADSTALRPVAEYVRRKLAKKLMAYRSPSVQTNASVDQFLREHGRWLKEGTVPSFSNYKNFLLQPRGIRFIFGAYQVGPYVIGTPEVDVPASVFREELEAGYREWFEEK